jgi:hypothetical protein
VQCGSGREYRPKPTMLHDLGGGWRCTTWLLAVEYTRPEGATPNSKLDNTITA